MGQDPWRSAYLIVLAGAVLLSLLIVAFTLIHQPADAPLCGGASRQVRRCHADPLLRARSHPHKRDSQDLSFVLPFLQEREVFMARFDLTDFEWDVIQPLLPTKVRGVKRVDDRRVLNSIFWRLRTGAPWADIPARYGPHTTCVNRFNRWWEAGN